ncbi:MAG: hypothetical protein HRU17_15305 [Polyangiaceae bacterium]|nr:hypothetical protein [Polyangiaceae bacterium]
MSAQDTSVEIREPGVGLLGPALIMGALGIFAVILAISGMAQKPVLSTRAAEGAEIKDQQRAEIESDYSWISKGRGVVHVPIDKAMAAVVEEIRKNPAAATPAAPDEDDAGAPDAAVEPVEEAEPAEEKKAEPAKVAPKLAVPVKVAPKPAVPAKVAPNPVAPVKAAPPAPAAPAPKLSP